MNKQVILSKIQKFGQDAVFVANVVLTQHNRPSTKLSGLLALLEAGHSVRTAQFSCDTLVIDGTKYGWELLESPKLIINGTWSRARTELNGILRDRVAQIEKDNGHRLWIGTQSNPDDRLQIVVSQSDMDMIPARGTTGTAYVTDLLTGKSMTVRRASCGLPRCLCALELVD